LHFIQYLVTLIPKSNCGIAYRRQVLGGANNNHPYRALLLMRTIIQDNDKQLAHYAAILWQRKYLIFLFVCVSIVLAYWGVRQVTPLYMAEAVVALKTRPQTLIDNAAPAAITRPDIASVKTEAESVQGNCI
jgi:hypothetical protein